MSNYSLQQVQQSEHSLFEITEEKLMKFESLVNQSQQITNIIERKAINNSYFYYLLRDVWFYFDSNRELGLQDESRRPESIIRHTFFEKLVQYVEIKQIKVHDLKQDFYNFLIAHFLAEGITNWLEERMLNNSVLAYNFQALAEAIDVLATIEVSKQDLQQQEIYLLKEEIVYLMSAEFTLHEAWLYKYLDDIYESYLHIVETLHTIVGEKTFDSKSFKEQTFILEELYQNQNLFEIADCAKEVLQFLKGSLFTHFSMEGSSEGDGINLEKNAPIIICPSQTIKLFPLRHQINGVILAIASIAKRLKRHLYILPISEEMDQMLFFEDGQFTEQDIIQLVHQYVTVEQLDFKPILNFASLLLRQKPDLKNGRIILLSDEYLLTRLHQDEAWKDTFLQFKNEQKILVSCILVYEKLEVLYTTFVDQLILRDRKQLLNNNTLVTTKKYQF